MMNPAIWKYLHPYYIGIDPVKGRAGAVIPIEDARRLAEEKKAKKAKERAERR